MYNKKVLILIGLLFLLTVSVVVTAQSQMSNINFYLGNTKINSEEIKAISKDGVKYINLPLLIKNLHVGADWDPDPGELYFKFGKFNYKLKEDVAGFTVDGVSSKLSAAPFEADEQLWIPVEFLLNLGLTVTHEDKQSLYMDWSDNYLLAIESTKYQGRPAFLLVSSKNFDVNKIKSFLLTNPDRLVLDLSSYKAHPNLNVAVQNELVKQVRFFQFTSDTLRLAFDLTQLDGCRIIPHPQYANQIYVAFNYFVEKVDFFQKENERKILIKTSFPAQYKVRMFQEPRRLIVDFEGATLGCPNETISGDNHWIKSVRLSQFNAQTVRVVLDLIDSAPYFIIPSRKDTTQLEIRTVQNINQVNWSETNQGGALTIEGDGELFETVHKLKSAHKLQIDFNYSKLKSFLKSPDVKSELVHSVKMQQIDRYISRIEVNLGDFVGYKVIYSNDRKKMTVIFNKSSLIGKVIVLDPGHGGVDSGAIGRQGTREKNINFDVAVKVKELLEDSGARVVLTRNDDTFISLYERSNIANNLNTDLFISLHANFHPKSEVKGIEDFYCEGRTDSAQLAKLVLGRLIEYTGLNNLGVKTANFVVVRETQAPSILVELGFLSNFEEESTLCTEEFREKAAEGIVQGIVDYLK